MTPCEKLGCKVGDKFVVVNHSDYFKLGEVVTLYYDDGTMSPKFANKTGSGAWYETLNKFEKIVDEAPTAEHPLMPVFWECIDQVTKGKGERHGGDSIPFLDQPWKHYAGLHGRGFLTGQAAKKLEEAASIKDGDEFIREVLGAIAYCGMAILYEKEKQK